MSNNRKNKLKKSLNVIPKYREQVDISKLCQTIILSAKADLKGHDKTTESLINKHK